MFIDLFPNLAILLLYTFYFGEEFVLKKYWKTTKTLSSN